LYKLSTITPISGVDPYYLAQKAQELGYHPEIILAGRRLNDGMGKYVASQIVKLMIKKGINVTNAEILLLGFTFKENCPDVRNTRVIDIIKELKSYDINIDVVDPWANSLEVEEEYKISTFKELPNKKYDSIVLAVAHSEFSNIEISKYSNPVSVVYDVKGILGSSKSDASL
jgi:UDP-N-acetyl-D-galactosamine dehydrogenase